MLLSLLLSYNFVSRATVINKNQQYQIHLARGLKHERKGNLKEANAEFRLALIAKPNESAPRMHLSLIALRQGARADATVYLSSCLAINAKDKECSRQYASLQSKKAKKR